MNFGDKGTDQLHIHIQFRWSDFIFSLYERAKLKEWGQLKLANCLTNLPQEQA